MAHITSNSCLFKDVRGAFVDQKDFKKVQEDLGKLTLQPGLVSQPPSLPPSKPVFGKYEDVDWMDENQELTFQDPPPPPSILWGDEELDAPVTKDMDKDFPKLGKAQYRDGNNKAEDLLTGGPDPLDSKENNKWSGAKEIGKGKELFPEALQNPLVPNTKAIIEEAQALKLTIDVKSPLHPKHRDFDAEKYFNKITGKWSCPYSNCRYLVALLSPPHNY